MAEFKEYVPGTFCWVDLATTDAAAAKKFYGELFGWNLLDTPIGPDMVYSMAQVEDKNVAALFQQGAEQQGIPPTGLRTFPWPAPMTLWPKPKRWAERC